MSDKTKKTAKLKFFPGLIIFLCACFFFPDKVFSSTLSLSPSNGSFEVESTFNVSVVLDTKGKTVNAFDIDLAFPPGKLQVVSPSTGNSIASLWVSPPKYSNENGTIQLRGGAPGGINTSGGNIATVSFRAKSVGSASVTFLDGTKVLLHDGTGSDSLSQLNNAIVDIVLPPPAGPVVVSSTHPDQSKWYNSNSVILKWDMSGETGIEGYSYHISKKAVDEPDDVSEGNDNDVVYKNLDNGHNYFHIKSKRQGVWGGVTHYSLNLDSNPPAEFPVSILPSDHTFNRTPVFEFETTDDLSGMNHYELKLVRIDKPEGQEQDGETFFIEATSPYVPHELEVGKYDMIIRAYDMAGNVQEVVQKMVVHKRGFYVGSGGKFVFGENFLLPWYVILLVLFIIMGISFFLACKLRNRHREIDSSLGEKKPADFELKKKLEELKQYRKKYGKIAGIFVGLLVCWGGMMLSGGASAQEQGAETRESLNPPLISTVSENISNDEIMYIGGKSETVNSKVNIYIQNLSDAQTYKVEVYSDSHGDWFYRHSGFLNSGNYLVWTQAQIDEEVSPPSPQKEISVRETALQFGSSRISKQELFAGMVVALSLLIALILVYNIIHVLRIRKKKKVLEKEMREVEDAVQRGFATLRRDIENELNLIDKVKMSKALSAEEKKIEDHLLRDLEDIERRIGKEVHDVARLEDVE